MKEFLTRFFYGTFLINVTLPKKATPQLALYPEKFLFENANNAESILKIMPDMAGIAMRDDISFRAIHNLSWICDVVAENPVSEKNIQELQHFLKIFLSKYQRYDAALWALPLLSERTLYCLYGLERLFKYYPNLAVQDMLAKLILKQAVFLRKKLRSHKNHPDYALLLIRSAIACLCLSEERKYLHQMLGTLYQHLDNVFSSDGGHISRNSALHFRILSELICLRDILVKAGVSVSTKLQSIVAKSCDYLDFLRHPDGGFAIFNGSLCGNKHRIDRIFEMSPGTVTPPASCLRDAQYYRMQAENIFILADFYVQTPHDAFRRQYQGALSFELSVGTRRVFVNCGAGDELGVNWKNALMQSDAHNTISIKDYKLIANNKRPEIVGKKTFKIISAVNHQGLILEGAHSFDAIDANNQNVPLSHYRRILLHKNGHIVQGEDWICLSKSLFKKSNTEKSFEFIVRFHLSPDIHTEISKTGSVIIQISEQEKYIFNAGSGKIALEQSVYTGYGYPVQSKQIVIRVNANSETTKIRWTMQNINKKIKDIKSNALDDVLEPV